MIMPGMAEVGTSKQSTHLETLPFQDATHTWNTRPLTSRLAGSLRESSERHSFCWQCACQQSSRTNCGVHSASIDFSLTSQVVCTLRLKIGPR